MAMQMLSPASRFLLILAAFVVVVAGMRAAESLLVPFLLSLFIAIIVTPLLSWLNGRGLPNLISIVFVIILVVIFGLIIGAIVGSSINSFSEDLPNQQQRLLALSDEIRQILVNVGINIELSQWREVFDPSRALTMAGNMLASLSNLMTNSLLILLTVAFILAEEVKFVDKLRYATGKSEKTLSALHHFTRSVNKYMAIKTLISLATGLFVMSGLMIIGVDYPVLWGLLTFLLNFIPTLGSIIASVPPILMAIIQLGFGEALSTALLFLAVNIVVGSVLEPRFMGRGLNISSLVVFLSLVFWGWVLGPIGTLLSVPLTITVKIALESFDDTRWIGVMLGANVKPEQVE
ncbi:MAG: AI-2 transport protein TqsA [Cellvibrionaceae bacterium]|jgi:AI-2 transport protein TqsA